MNSGDAPITFLVTDIEDSTGLWERDPAGMRSALAEHDRCLREHIGTQGGTVVKSLGDGFLATFPDPASAVRAVQTAILSIRHPGLDGDHATVSDGPRIRVRAAVHTGPAEHRDGDYFGPALNLLSRVLELAQGGRVLLSCAAAANLAPDAVAGARLDLGVHRLRGLSHPERLFQIVHPEIPCETRPPQASQPLQHNLPAQVSSFIGREREIELLKDQLSSSRLVTVVGAGGTGKTRLALRVAEELHSELEHGAWFVDLAPLGDPAFIPAALAGALRVRERASQPLVQTLAEWMRERSLLLVVDNCEHLLDGVAPLVQRLLAAAPLLRILATSREPLELPGERLHTLHPLELPQQKRIPPAARLLEYDAIRLFVDRARLRREDFELTEDNAPPVVEICRRLDGLPLAIELAAARIRHLSVAEIAERVSNAVSLLSSRMRSVEPRQQTLRALIDWSYELLTPPERLLLRRLSVFAGGFTLKALQEVCASAASESSLDSGEVEDLLHRLGDRSLVVVEGGGAGERRSECRYSLLETVRQYCRERLAEAGETEALSERHAAWCLELVQQADGELQRADQQDWLNRLDTEHDNLRAALDWTVQAASAGTSPNAAEQAFRMAVGLWRFWWMRGHLGQGRTWLERVLALPDEVFPRLRPRARTGAGSMAWFQGDYEAALRHHTASLEGWAQLGDAPGVASATNNLATVFFARGDLTRARELFAESAAAYRTLKQPLHLGQSLGNMGRMAALLGEYAEARLAVEESLSLLRELGDRVGEASALSNRAFIAAAEGETTLARELYQQALRIRVELADVLGLAGSLEGLAHLFAKTGEAARAARFLGAAEGHRIEAGTALTVPERVHHEAVVTGLQECLGDREFARLFSEGMDQPLAQLLAE